ncbi:MAG: hypothetical protein K8953_00205 [Proteobacteria bacterium]|nr:hypothetical protein [Pseudomonadota bacterium]
MTRTLVAILAVGIAMATCVAAPAHEPNRSFCTGGYLNALCTIYRVYQFDEDGQPRDVDCEYIGGWDRESLEQPETAGNHRYPPTVIRTICAVK